MYIPCANCGQPTTIPMGAKPPTVKVVHPTCTVLPKVPPQQQTTAGRMLTWMRRKR